MKTKSLCSQNCGNLFWCRDTKEPKLNQKRPNVLLSKIKITMPQFCKKEKQLGECGISRGAIKEFWCFEKTFFVDIKCRKCTNKSSLPKFICWYIHFLLEVMSTNKCDNYVPQWWVELDDGLSWLFTTSADSVLSDKWKLRKWE